jgi:putative peptidoglycan lipid II flippase
LQPGWPLYLLRLLLATAAMALTVLWVAPEADIWLGWDWQRRTMVITKVCALGVVSYVTLHLLLGTRLRHLRAPAVS